MFRWGICTFFFLSLLSGGWGGVMRIKTKLLPLRTMIDTCTVFNVKSINTMNMLINIWTAIVTHHYLSSYWILALLNITTFTFLSEEEYSLKPITLAL